MSANNFIQIVKSGKLYLVKNVDADTGGGFVIGEARTLKGAIKIAEEYRQSHVVEYDIRFSKCLFI